MKSEKLPFVIWGKILGYWYKSLFFLKILGVQNKAFVKQTFVVKDFFLREINLINQEK